jgi:hypothetical protein
MLSHEPSHRGENIAVDFFFFFALESVLEDRMTDEQRRRQRVELMLDLETAEEGAAALRNALKSKADKLNVMAEWLSTTARSIDAAKLEAIFFSNTLHSHVNVLKDVTYQEAMNYEEIVNLREEYISAQKRVEELGARCRELKASA